MSGARVKALEWRNAYPKLSGYPDVATDVFGGEWTRWFIDGEEYFKPPSSDRMARRKGSADDYHEARIISALEPPTDAQVMAHPKVRGLVKAGTHLAFMAQTTGGTSGQDVDLVAAIDKWCAALAALPEVKNA